MTGVPPVKLKFQHKRVLKPDNSGPAVYVVTKVTSDTVYYKPVDGGHSECCDLDQFYTRVFLAVPKPL